ncbi:MAG: (Fe-S)-binding protein [Clostridia bacterium]|nr:(Fe-S)-binding protein [Clostridia bacterium]
MQKEALLEIIMKCNRCGVCQEVCPTYKISGSEFQVARGRNRLIRLALEGQLDLNEEPEIEKFINQCLLCKACEVSCPAGVPTTELISEVRKYYTGTKGLPLLKKIMYRGVFSHNKRISLVRKLGRIYQKTGVNRLVKFTGILNHTDEMLPDLPPRNVREQIPYILKSLSNPAHKVAYFLGCSVNNFFSSIGVATLKVLQKNNCQVVVPEVNCCGAPHQSAGDIEEFKRLAQKNLDVFKDLDVEAIIVDCATCGSVLKDYVHFFQEDPYYHEIALKVAAKIKDISSFLLEIDYQKDLGEIRAKVTYHDPCHAIRYLKVTEAPRKLLKNIPGLELVEMKEADMCCGGAGSYGVFNPGISRKILAHKMKNYRETEAQILATSCPACTMQLAFGIKLFKLSGSVKHPVELLAEAYEKAREK